MALGIIITALIIVSGLLKIFLEKNGETIGQNFDEMKSWFSIPSVLNSSEASLDRAPIQFPENSNPDEDFDNENIRFFIDEEFISRNNSEHSLKQKELLS